MPVSVRFEGHSLFFMRAFLEVAVDDVRGAIAEIHAHRSFRPGSGLLIDNREVTSTRTVGEVALITAEFGKLIARGVSSIAVVTGRELDVSQVFAGFASTVGGEVKVFLNEQQARDWLDARAVSKRGQRPA